VKFNTLSIISGYNRPISNYMTKLNRANTLDLA
jgi:hypothetical protein